MTTTHPTLLDRLNAMKAMTVTVGVDEVDGPYLLVDASAISNNENDPHQWLLFPDDDEPDKWTHGPSGVTATLGEALWGIASSYRIDHPDA